MRRITNLIALSLLAMVSLQAAEPETIKTEARDIIPCYSTLFFVTATSYLLFIAANTPGFDQQQQFLPIEGSAQLCFNDSYTNSTRCYPYIPSDDMVDCRIFNGVLCHSCTKRETIYHFQPFSEDGKEMLSKVSTSPSKNSYLHNLLTYLRHKTMGTSDQDMVQEVAEVAASLDYSDENTDNEIGGLTPETETNH